MAAQSNVLLGAVIDQFPTAIFLFVYAALFAAVEIEIEGPHGWADKLPTWYRVRPWYARLFARLVGGKPLTGYHATMLPLAAGSLHAGFAFGLPWSAAAELQILAAFVFWSVVWDFLWFLWNPAFGWQRFRQRRVWWLGRVWRLGFPHEYWTAAAASIVLATLPGLWGNHTVITRHLASCAWMVLLVLVVAVPLTGPYRRWHAHMRRPGTDERALVDRPPDG